MPPGSFFLPDGMTANQFGDYLALLTGYPAAPITTVSYPEIKPVFGLDGGSAFKMLKEQSRLNRGISFSKQWSNKIEQHWPLPMTAQTSSFGLDDYRRKLRSAFTTADQFSLNCDWVVMSTEGIGKTTALMEDMAARAMSLTLDNGRMQFSVFACRSLDQAKAKAAEAMARTGLSAVVIQSFWKHYEETCKLKNVSPTPQNKFDDRSVNGILGQIKAEQPAVFEHLEERAHAPLTG